MSVCNEKTLKKYNNPAIPVIDLICINDKHIEKNECFLFQVKVSATDRYFDKTGKPQSELTGDEKDAFKKIYYQTPQEVSAYANGIVSQLKGAFPDKSNKELLRMIQNNDSRIKSTKFDLDRGLS